MPPPQSHYHHHVLVLFHLLSTAAAYRHARLLVSPRNSQTVASSSSRLTNIHQNRLCRHRLNQPKHQDHNNGQWYVLRQANRERLPALHAVPGEGEWEGEGALENDCWDAAEEEVSDMIVCGSRDGDSTERLPVIHEGTIKYLRILPYV